MVQVEIAGAKTQNIISFYQYDNLIGNPSHFPFSFLGNILLHYLGQDAAFQSLNLNVPQESHGDCSQLTVLTTLSGRGNSTNWLPRAFPCNSQGVEDNMIELRSQATKLWNTIWQKTARKTRTVGPWDSTQAEVALRKFSHKLFRMRSPPTVYHLLIMKRCYNLCL